VSGPAVKFSLHNLEMANTRRANRRSSRKNMMSRKHRRSSRKNSMSRRSRCSRKNMMSRRNRRNNMMGGRARSSRRRGIVSRVYSPVSALGTGAGKTVTTAVSAAANVFGTGVRGLDKTLKTAAGTINNTVSKIFSRRRRANRRH
jgi:hypothetical protein